MMPPAHSDRIQSTERSGPVHTSESRPPGRRTLATSGTARASSTQCQADWAMTTSTDADPAGSSSAWPASTSMRGSDAARTARMRSSGSTAVRCATRSASKPREDAGAGADFEDVVRVRGKKPVECCCGWAGAQPVVVVRHCAERAAQDGGVLVLAHVGEFSEGRSRNSTPPPVPRPGDGSVGPQWPGGRLCRLLHSGGGQRDTVVAHAEVAQW